MGKGSGREVGGRSEGEGRRGKKGRRREREGGKDGGGYIGCKGGKEGAYKLG